jgi:hypothetical protein
LEKVVNQDKLLNAGGTKKKATALYAGHGVSQSGRLDRPAGRHPGKQPRHKKEKGKQKKRCATKDCKNIVKVSFHKFCDACFSSRKEKSSADDSSALDDVPAAVREQNHNRKLNTLKKKMAQLGSVKTNQSVRLSSTKPMLSWLTWPMPTLRRIRKSSYKKKRNKRLVLLNCLSIQMRQVTCQYPRLILNLKRKRRHRMTSWTARSPIALFNALPAARYRQILVCDYLQHSNRQCHPLTLALQVYALVSKFP